MKPLTKIPAILMLVIVSSALYAQDDPFSSHIQSDKRKPGYLELQIAETNSTLKTANKAVPFDKVFYLKVKRQKTTEKPKFISQRTVVRDTVWTTVLADDGKVQKISQEEREFPATESKKELHHILKIKITEEGDCQKEKEINANHYPVGAVYEEDDYVYILINPLNPEKSYSVEIQWDNTVNEAYRISTVLPVFKNRLANRLLPQVGVSFAGLNKTPDLFRVKPSLLFAIDYRPFRPLDPDVPIHTFKQFAPQRFSFLLGLTLTSMAEENMREDLFKNSNIMAGIAYQPWEGMRFSYGGVLFLANNPDIMFSHRRRFALTSYLAVTLDLRLNDLLGGIISTLGLKP